MAEVIKLLTVGDQPRLVNVNLPGEPVGIRWTHQSVRQYNGRVVESQDPNGRRNYWFSPVPLTAPDKDSDRWAVENNLVSLTPIRLSLTDDEWLEKLCGAPVKS